MRVRKLLVGITVTVAGALALGRTAPHAQSRPTALAATAPSELRSLDLTVDRMTRDGELRARRVDTDGLLPSRTHERLDQFYKGVKVHGGDVARQIESGSTISIFGTIYNDINISVEPGLGVDDAARIVRDKSGVDLGPTKLPTLIVFPTDAGYRLAYRAVAFGAQGGAEYIIDATTGTILRQLDAAQRQAAVGAGTGVLGDAKKVSATSASGAFIADDSLRPPLLVTFDIKGNVAKTLNFLNGTGSLLVSDQASDTNNQWTDTAVVDAHAHAGYVYDYYYKRFGRRGLDNNNFRILSIVHSVTRESVVTAPVSLQDYFVNAFYAGGGVMVYGEGLPPGLLYGGQSWNYLAGGLDIVAHELTHGVTDFTSNLAYVTESGALNESFSDMIGVAVEFFYQQAGNGILRADYLIGEDVITPGGIRSMANPGAYGQPDHYSQRRVFDGPPSPSNDNGGVHINSGIGNQWYYLAIEGGTNRTSGVTLTGVGAVNREQIERVAYRAFTQLLPSNATYALARVATAQAARDLYGAGGAVERAVTQAWTAVGVF